MPADRDRGLSGVHRFLQFMPQCLQLQKDKNSPCVKKKPHTNQIKQYPSPGLLDNSSPLPPKLHLGVASWGKKKKKNLLFSVIRGFLQLQRLLETREGGGSWGTSISSRQYCSFLTLRQDKPQKCSGQWYDELELVPLPEKWPETLHCFSKGTRIKPLIYRVEREK